MRVKANFILGRERALECRGGALPGVRVQRVLSPPPRRADHHLSSRAGWALNLMEYEVTIIFSCVAITAQLTIKSVSVSHWAQHTQSRES